MTPKEMMLELIKGCNCRECFSWDYPEELIKHNHNKFIFIMNNKRYLMIIEEKK